ncbi:MAG: LemA family protein [Clostridia bacterium]
MTAGTIIAIIIGILIFVAIIIVCWGIGVHNSLIKMRNNVDEAFSTMDVYMKKRYDLIPNFVEVVKGYAKHENETLQGVIAARNSAMSANTPEEKIKSENMLTGTLKSLFAVTESYPELKANTNFLDLQATLKNLEYEIAQSRKYYNGSVKVYNVQREIFPSNIIAKWFKFEKKPLFELDDIQERKNVKVQF